MKFIDLRSDTVTQPTPAMLEAITKAQLGDDVWDDDPTVHQLQEMAANRLGKEASLFVPSGTMGNLIAALVHCDRGEEIIVGDKSHTFSWEAGNIAVVGGIHSYQLRNQVNGTLALDGIEAAIRSEDVHCPRTKAIFLENTQNNCGGIAIPPPYFEDVRQLAAQHDLLIHLDGARLFNATAALECSVQEFTQYVDSVTVCLSKGLCAPVGSILAGSKEFIYEARRARKMLGGGMRQAGILAAAGIIALEQMVGRLREDHHHARILARKLSQLRGIEVPEIITPQKGNLTNMVYFSLADGCSVEPESLIKQLEQNYKIKIGRLYGRQFRLVTHYWITSEAVDKTLSAFQEILEC